MSSVLFRRLTVLSTALTAALVIPSAPIRAQSDLTVRAGALAAAQAGPAAGTALPSNFEVREFESLAQQIVSQGKIPGMAMAIVHDGRIISARGYGLSKPFGGTGVTAHTVYRLASVSKSFASTTTATVVNEGKLSWNTPVRSIVREFNLIDPAAAESVDVADLLSHRVGLPKNALDRDIEHGMDFAAARAKLATVKLTCRPGTCFNYQNVAYSVIGDVLTRTTGQPYGQLVQQRVLKPLGMYDSSVGLYGLRGSAAWAVPTVYRNGGWSAVEPKPTYYEVSPAAGVNSSVYDMAQYMIAHLGHRPDMLSSSMLDTLHREVVNTPKEAASNEWRRARLNSAGYALGWRVLNYMGRDVVFHGGAVQGYRTLIAMMPSKDIGIVVLWNSESGTPSGLMPMVMDRALGLSPRSWVRVNGLNLGEIEADDAVPQSGNQTGAQRDPLGEFIRNNVDSNRQ